MNKPITILADEFKSKQIALINNSKLPYFIIESILKDCIQEVHIASQQQLKIDRDKYNNELLKLTLEGSSAKDGD